MLRKNLDAIQAWLNKHAEPAPPATAQQIAARVHERENRAAGVTYALVVIGVLGVLVALGVWAVAALITA